MSSKLFLKAAASLLVLVVSLFFAVHGVDGHKVMEGLRRLPLSAVLLYVATLAVTHFFRSWRWDFLLRPLGVSVPLRRLLPISSVGFMAILALPVRAGEFVRPYLVAREQRIRMSAALGTVAVERIVDGLLLSVLFFVSYLLSPHDLFSRELRLGAWLSLLLFVVLTTFLAAAQVWTDSTIELALRVTLLRRLAPARADKVAERIRSVIAGFKVMRDRRNFGLFLAQSLLYWGMNGFGMWVLAVKMGLPISLGAAFTTMAVTGVVLSLPNSPGLVGQFHAAIKLGLSAYLPMAVVNANGIAYAIVLHGVQSIWYVGIGVLCWAAMSAAGAAGGPHASLADAVVASNRAAEEVAAADNLEPT